MTFLDTSDLQDDVLLLKRTGTAQAKPEKDLAPAYYFDIVLRSENGLAPVTSGLEAAEE